jgi:hypothetical protein
MKDIQATGEVFNPQKPELQNMKFSSLFSNSMGHIDLLDPDPADQNHCGSMRIHADPDSQHWSKAVLRIRILDPGNSVPLRTLDP